MYRICKIYKNGADQDEEGLWFSLEGAKASAHKIADENPEIVLVKVFEIDNTCVYTIANVVVK